MILVTGASGLVGREVAARLAGRARLALRDPKSPESVRFDFQDPSTFAAALDGGADVAAALRLASGAAALKVTRAGAGDAIPTRAEVDAFLADQPI